MKENQFLVHWERFFRHKWEDFADWATDKEHPRSRLNKQVFFYDILKLAGLILISAIISSNVDKINGVIPIFLRIGSIIQLVILFFIFKKIWHLSINLKYFFRGLDNWAKALIAIILVLILFGAFLNQGEVIDKAIGAYDKINFTKIKPLEGNLLNISFGNFSLSKLNFGSSIKCQADFDEDMRKAKIKNSDLRVKVVEKKSFEGLSEATSYVNSWDVDNGNNVINYIRNNIRFPETIELILVRYDFRECFFGECLEYSQLKFSVCDGEKAMHPKGTLFGNIFGGLFG